MSLPGATLSLTLVGSSPLKPSIGTVIGQGTVSGYCSSSSVICLKNQTGGNSGRNSYLLCTSSVGGSTSNQVDNAQLYLSVSTDKGATWTNTLLKSNSGFASWNQAGLTELADGTLLLPYAYDTNANSGGTGSGGNVVANNYIGKSTDGGVTWSNVPSSSTTPSNKITTPFAGIFEPWESIQQRTSGDLYWPWYGKLGSSDTGWSVVLMKCPNGSDPTNGSNWTNTFTIISNDSTNLWAEPSIVQISDTSWVCVTRNPTDGKAYICVTANGGSTWTSPTHVSAITNLVGSGTDIMKSKLLKLTDGTLIWVFGTLATPQTILFSKSTDSGSTWGAPWPLFVPDIGAGNQNGYPSGCLLGDGRVAVSLYSYGGTGGTIGPSNLSGIVTSESWLKNPF